MNGFDISSELQIVRSGNGIKLVRPTDHSHSHRSVQHFLSQRVSLYFLNAQSEVISINSAAAEINGFVSEKDVIGKSVYDLYSKTAADRARHHDLTLLQSNKIQIIEETVTRKDHYRFHNITIDAPWYSDDNQLIGMFGCSLVTGTQPVAEGLAYLQSLGLMQPHKHHHHIALTGREQQCLEFVLQGKSYKQIATIMQLSHRTVEHYIEKIKQKFGVKTKYQLIELF